MSLRRSITALVILAVAAAPVGAQSATSDSTLVDRVVAVVGDSVVLLSQIEEQVAKMRLEGAQLPTDSTKMRALRDTLLNRWIDRLLVLEAAAKDTLVMRRLNPTGVRQAAEQQIEQTTASMGGSAAMQQALQKDGFTPAQFREYVTSQIRQQQIYQMYLQLKLQNAPPIEITDAELHAAFQQESPTLPQRPKYLKLSQVVISPQASDTAQAAAKALAESLLQRIRNGENFAELAKRYSDDPGSAPLGGQLGWLRRGRTVKAFEDAAFSLAPGQVSNVVKTVFGYHIIKVEHRRPGEVEASHILITPKIHQSDVERARKLAEEVLAKARADSSMSKLYDEYGDPLTPDSMTVPFNQLDSLPPAYGALRTTNVGEVIGPLKYDASGKSSSAPAEVRFAIVKVKQIRQAGAWTFDEIKTRLTQSVEREKQTQRILEALRRKTYIDIRM